MVSAYFILLASSLFFLGILSSLHWFDLPNLTQRLLTEYLAYVFAGSGNDN